MKKLNKVVAAGLMAGMLMVGPASVQAAEVTVGTDVVSSYLYRGITLNSDAVVQPSVDIAHPSGLGLNIWANFDLGDDDGVYEKREFSEVDFDLSYTVDFDAFSLTVGYIEYLYPSQTDVAEDAEGGLTVTRLAPDREAYVSVGAELVPGLDLGLTVYQSMASSDGTYAVLSAGYGLEVIDGLTLGLNGSVAYGAKEATGSALLGEPKAGWHDYLVGVSADMDVAEGLSVNAFVNYVGALDSDVLPSELVREDVFGGVGVYYTF